MKIVPTKSIKNVDLDRLHDSLAQIHHTVHTEAGLHEFSNTRRSLIEMGVKGRTIAARIHALTGDVPSCRFCWGGADYSVDIHAKQRVRSQT
jgi:hypothetical protein